MADELVNRGARRGTDAFRRLLAVLLACAVALAVIPCFAGVGMAYADDIPDAGWDPDAPNIDTGEIPAPDDLPSTGFYDVPEGEWYVTEGWISYVTSTGLMTGYTYADGSPQYLFGPELSVTRGQIATILYRYANPNSTDTTVVEDFAGWSYFADVPAYSYYTAAVNWCYEQGIITGYTDGDGNSQGAFGPEDYVTRAQLATMVWRFAANYLGVDVWSVDPSAFYSLPDHDAIYPFAVDAMIWCADRGLITGNIDPWGQPWLESESIASRAQTAKVVTVLVRDIAG